MSLPFMPPFRLSYQSGGGGDFAHSEPSSDRALTIAFLVPEDRQTGTYFRYHNLAIALRQLGHAVTVYSQSSRNRLRPSEEVRDGVPYVLSATVPGNRWMLPPTNPATLVRRWLTRVAEADVYHLFQPFPTAALAWQRLQRRRRGLFVYDWDDFWINEEFGLKNPVGIRARWAAFCVSRLERHLPGRSQLTTTVSHPLAELAREWGAPEARVVYNGVWPQPVRDQMEARARLGLRPDAFYVGLMGWSGEVKWCLEAIRRYGPLFPRLRLAITGRDPGDTLNQYEDVRDRVDVLGALPEDQFLHFNPSLDLGLVPMRQSEFNRYRLPYKLTDHLAGGTPVLCSRIGEAARLAEELSGIISCPPTLEGWLDAFRHTVDTLHRDPHEFTVSREDLYRRFSWLQVARETEQAYRSTASARARITQPSRR